MFANGDKFDGEWRNSIQEGKGTMVFAAGNKFEGEWKNGKQEGYGIMTWPDGSIYKGTSNSLFATQQRE